MLDKDNTTQFKVLAFTPPEKYRCFHPCEKKLVVLLTFRFQTSLAFDTIYAGSTVMWKLSVYARQFVSGLERPDADKRTFACDCHRTKQPAKVLVLQ
jgi:hypothetical protein